MKDRLVLPILIPVLAAAAIFLIIFSAGHALLEAQEAVSNLASLIAIVGAAAILGVASLLYVKPKIGTWPVYTILAVPASVLLATGLFFFVRTEGGEAEAGGEQVAAIAPPGPIQMTFTDNKFSLTEFAIVVNQEYQMQINNGGTALHNVHIRGVNTAAGGELVTQFLPGGGSETVSFTIPQTGTFTYICDVHPVEMVGEVTVVEEGAATGGGGNTAGGGANPGPGTITVIETDNKFNPTQLEAVANQETTMIVINQGSAIHNVHFVNVRGANGQDILTPLSPGGTRDEIKFTIATPGTYDFRCDVHPVEMVGKITVR